MQRLHWFKDHDQQVAIRIYGNQTALPLSARRIFEPAFEALQDARQISGASRPGHSSTIIKESSEELYKHY